jgi:hypothetical protein
VPPREFDRRSNVAFNDPASGAGENPANFEIRRVHTYPRYFLVHIGLDVGAPALESEEQGNGSGSPELKKLDVPVGRFQRGDGSKALVSTPL